LPPSRTPPNDLPAAPPPAALRVAGAARRGLAALGQRLAPPQFALLDMVMGHWRTHALAAITEAGVADALAEGPRAVADVARALGLDEDALRRVLRALAREGVFEELPDDRFGHNALSRPLLRDDPHSVRHMVLEVGSERNMRVWSRLGHSLKTGETSWRTLHEGTLWDHLAAHPEEAERFHGAMVELTRESAVSYARAYDFGRHRTVADLGGGEGELISVILRAHPGLRGLTVDGPQALAQAPATFARHGVTDRAATAEADIEREVPAGLDVYVAKNILHGFTDAQAEAALKVWRRAARADSRLVLIEVVVPEAGPYFAFLDLQMLIGSGGRERTEPEFRALLARGGFRLDRVIDTGTPMSVLVADAA
jgi:hypothetical protein